LPVPFSRFTSVHLDHIYCMVPWVTPDIVNDVRGIT